MSNNTIQNGLNIATVVGIKSYNVNGGKHVIDHSYPEHTVTDGAMVVNAPAVGGIIFEGDLGQFDYNTNTVKHMKVFAVNASAASTASAVQIKAGAGYHIPEVGEALMVAPSNFATETGTAVTVTGAVLHSSGAYYDVTFSGAIGAALTNSSVLVEAEEAGSGKAPLVVPNVAFVYDTYIYETPASTYNASTGFKYYVALFDACAILGRKLTVGVPAGARVNLRAGYSDIKIVE